LFPDISAALGLLEKVSFMDLRKVYGGTPVGTESRCDTCVYSRIIRGYAENERITICDRLFEPIHIPFKVMECTDYADKRLPCVEDMEQIAWYLRSKSAGHKAGFVAPAGQDDPQENQEPEIACPEVAASINKSTK
jgi:hypothetical protein